MSIVPVEIEGIERALVQGDLSQLTEEQRLLYYRRVCESIGLNPLTKPFEYLRLSGKLVLYATRACADQLRQIHGVSTEIVSQAQVGDLYVVHVRARTRDGRLDEDLGIVPTKGLTGDALANAILKAVTKAKRRVTLSICGLGWLDETEVESIPGAERVAISEAHGEPAEVVEPEPDPAPAALEPSVPAESEHRPVQAEEDAAEHAQKARAWLQKVCREHGVTFGWAMEWLRAQGKGDLSKLSGNDLRAAGRAIKQQGERIRAMAGVRQ